MSSSERPYPPSWFDRFTQWIDRMPGPNYLYYVGLGLVQFGYVVALLWFNDRLSGPLGFRQAFFVVVASYFLWVRYALDGVAAAALDALRPMSRSAMLTSRGCATS